MNLLHSRIGFMQGRLSSMIDGKIQAFPWDSWRDEFSIAKALHIPLMEWTLDHERLYENPLMTETGRAEILALSNSNNIKILSLTGDCFMQAPFWKVTDEAGIGLMKDFLAVVKSCSEVGISILVVPLVDNGRIENIEQENKLINFLESQKNLFLSCKLRIVFESDFGPDELARFIKRFNPDIFGINYDIGNSAALGFDPRVEFNKYGEHIMNVHIKDRKLSGTTVPLGSGDANFKIVFSELSRLNYKGNFILQTARAIGEGHAEVLAMYRDQTITWLKNHAT
jgi:L-ribulose-5-phosphate 3-epimerase